MQNLGMLPQINSRAESQRTYHIDSVIPAGVLSNKMRKNVTSQASYISTAARHSLMPTGGGAAAAAGKLSVQSMKKAKTSHGRPSMATRKLPASRGASQNQRRQIVSSTSHKRISNQIGGDLLSAIHSNGDSVSIVGSFLSPKPSSTLNLLNQQHLGGGGGSMILAGANHNLKGAGGTNKIQRKLANPAATTTTRANSNYKVSRYLNKVQKRRMGSPEKQLIGDQDPAVAASASQPNLHANTVFQLPPLIQQQQQLQQQTLGHRYQNNLAYDDYKTGQITNRDYYTSEGRSSNSILSKAINSQFQSNDASPDNKFRVAAQQHQAAISSMTKTISMPTIDRRLERKQLEIAPDDSALIVVPEYKFDPYPEHLTEVNSCEEETKKKGKDAQDVDKLNFDEIKVSEENGDGLDRASQNDSQLGGGQHLRSTLLQAMQTQADQLRRSSTHENIHDRSGETRNVFSAPQVSGLPKTHSQEYLHGNLNAPLQSGSPPQVHWNFQSNDNKVPFYSSLLQPPPSEKGTHHHLDSQHQNIPNHQFSLFQSMPHLSNHQQFCSPPSMHNQMVGSHLLSPNHLGAPPGHIHPLYQSCHQIKDSHQRQNLAPLDQQQQPLQQPQLTSQQINQPPQPPRCQSVGQQHLVSTPSQQTNFGCYGCQFHQMMPPPHPCQSCYPQSMQQHQCQQQHQQREPLHMVCGQCQQMPGGGHLHHNPWQQAPIVHYITNPKVPEEGQQQRLNSGTVNTERPQSRDNNRTSETSTVLKVKKRKKKSKRKSSTKHIEEISPVTTITRLQSTFLNQSMSVHVQTMPEMRVIQTQTDPPPTEKPSSPPKPKIIIDKLPGSMEQQQTLKAYLKNATAPTDIKQQQQAQQDAPRIVNARAVGVVKKAPETSTLLAVDKSVDMTTMSQRLKASDLPPADMLMHHIDRVSQRLHKVKTAMHEESQGNTSFISKGSFRQSSKKRGSELRKEKNMRTAFFRKNNAFNSSQDSDEYSQQLDQFLKCEEATTTGPGNKMNPSLAKAAANAHSKNYYEQFKVTNQQIEVPQDEEDQAKEQTSPKTIRKESIDLSTTGGGGGGGAKKNDHFSDFMTPQKLNIRDQEKAMKSRILSPIANSTTQQKRSEIQMEQDDDGSPKIVIAINDQDDEQSSLMRKRLDDNEARSLPNNSFSQIRADQNPEQHQLAAKQLHEGSKTSPNRDRQQEGTPLCQQNDEILNSAQIDRLSKAVEPFFQEESTIQHSEVTPQGGAAGAEIGTFAKAVTRSSKSILKSTSVVVGGDKTRSIRLEFNQIDEDSSEEGGPPSGGSNGNKSPSFMQVTKVKFDTFEKSRDEEAAIDAQLGQHLQGIRDSQYKDSLLLKGVGEIGSSQKSANKADLIVDHNDQSSSGSNSENSSSYSEEDQETRGDFIKRVQDERKRICQQSANKVPEQYQYYFQNSDQENEEDSEKKKLAKKEKRDRRNTSVLIKPNSNRFKRRNSTRKLTLQRQSTLKLNESAILASDLLSNMEKNELTPPEKSNPTSKKSFSEQVMMEKSQRSKKSIVRTQTYDPDDWDFKKAMIKDLKRYAEDNGAVAKKHHSKKRRRSSVHKIRTAQTTRESDIDSAAYSKDELKLKRKMSNNNTTIRELPGLEGGTSYNSPTQSPGQSPLGSFREIALYRGGNSNQLAKAAIDTSPSEFKIGLHPSETKLSIQPVPQQQTLRKSSIREIMNAEDRDGKPFLKRKSTLPFLKIKPKTVAGKAAKKKVTKPNLSVYSDKLLTISQSVDALGQQKSVSVKQAAKKRKIIKISSQARPQGTTTNNK